MKKYFLAILVVAGISAGCASTPPLPDPTWAEVEAADFGQRPSNVTGIYKSMLEATYQFKDPESLKTRNVVMYKHWRVYEGEWLYGYLICGQYDAKNGFGGYNGYEHAGFFYRNGLQYTGNVAYECNPKNRYKFRV